MLQEAQESPAEAAQLQFFSRKLGAVVPSSAGPALQARQGGVVKDAGATVISAEAGRALRAAGCGVLRSHHGTRDVGSAVSPEERGGQTGLIVVFYEANAAGEERIFRAVEGV